MHWFDIQALEDGSGNPRNIFKPQGGVFEPVSLVGRVILCSTDVVNNTKLGFGN